MVKKRMEWHSHVCEMPFVSNLMSFRYAGQTKGEGGIGRILNSRVKLHVKQRRMAHKKGCSCRCWPLLIHFALWLSVLCDQMRFHAGGKFSIDVGLILAALIVPGYMYGGAHDYPLWLIP